MGGFGIPYAPQVEVKGKWYNKCPLCGKLVRQKERKDFESFTGSEYAKHFEENHVIRLTYGNEPPSERGIRHPGDEELLG